MDEHSYIRSVHKKLPKHVYRWKIAARFVRGILDAWYSSTNGDLWVEYKWLGRTPTSRFTPALTGNQKIWANDRYDEGRNVAVVVASPAGGLVITGKRWNEKQEPPHIWQPTGAIAEWIQQQVS